ncbi:4'-phosphopantetheinyl transferase superfamily protein [Geodermatophilus pulveris]|uniref:4'-phosphopantetheinyl transferase superfamily protein n=1 Tax=Geodermatophilus pulveris TaxID=1564159 RepID=A0A239GVJ8_9ACTN|nr:4'-phosphopantetheinyl transferase superfamily protein [Geodermatophilus pulveris]SNS73127.1 4'-phosphopantetheinyl transferase superfamily protein [Geodermatophilus pulveris]
MPPTAPAPAPAAGPAAPPGVLTRLVDLAAGGDALARAAAVLDPAELARARRGRPAVHRRRVLLRAALRAALADELGVAPGAVPLHADPSGRPRVGVPGLDASCSASGALGVVAVGRRCRVGVDVQAVAPWTDDVLDEGWLARAEQEALTRLPAGARPLAATRAWTQKEAVLKARGTGLRADPSATVTVVGRAEGVVAGWTVRDVPVPDGWVASLAVARDEETRR